MTTSVAPRPSRCIALVKPAAATDERIVHALQLLDSIMWACQGTTRSPWTVGPPESADVVVIPSSGQDERAAAWRAQGKPVIEIATEAPAEASETSVLVYPFRTVQVLALLDRLDAHLSANEQPTNQPTTGTPTSNPTASNPWAFVEALRTLRSVQNSDAWLVGKDSRNPVLWLRGDAVSYAADAVTVQAIRKGALNPSKLTLLKSSDPSGGPQLRSAIELSWFAGYYASAQLAPSLNDETRYRIAHWPNFGLIRPLPSQMRIAASLSSAAASLKEVATRANVTIEEAARTLNALYACDAIAPVKSEEAPQRAKQSAAPKPRGGLARFLSNMRRHLGIGEDRA